MKRHLLAAAIAVATAGTALAQDDLAGRAMPLWDVVLVAHRGLAPDMPENTMAAFRNVIDRGVGVIEIDLRGTLDGEVVIMHDETVDRTTDGTGDVTQLTLAQLQALDAGVHAGEQFRGERVPTFEEVLELAKASGVMLLLDIKLSPTLDRERIVRLTEAHDAVLNVIVGVRSLEDLAEFRALNPNLRTLGFIPNPQSIEPFVAAGVEIIRLWPEWIHGQPRSEGQDLGACLGVEGCLVGRVRDLGRPVWTTADDSPRPELINLIEAGVNGILTDIPFELRQLLDDIDALNAAR
jgi:glycerophosphoryl diester phosphodiesterase